MTDYFQGIWRCRYFWLSLVRTDLRTRYRRSVLGLGWSLVQPLAMTAILCVVFHTLFNQPINWFAPYLLCGLAFWGFLQLSILQGCACMLNGQAYIRQHPAPLAIYPLRVMLGAGFHFLVTLGVVLLLTALVRGFSAWVPLLTLPFTVVLLALFGWALAVLAGFLNVHFPDLQHLLEVLLQMAFYVTPIIYPANQLRDRSLGFLVDQNPLAAFVELLREPIVEGQFPTRSAVVLAAGTVAVACAGATLALAKLERRLIYHL
jgi:lipopolysaccharide transport system permease protein